MTDALEIEDIRKIHEEVNQIISQRHSITAAAITNFGLMTAWMLSKLSENGPIIWEISFLHAVVSLSLYIWLFALRRYGKVLTMYLIANGFSKWEVNSKRLRSKGVWAYTKSIALLFILLNALSTAVPFFYSPKVSIIYYNISLGSFLLILTFIILTAFYSWGDNEDNVLSKWRNIKKEAEARDDFWVL